MNEIHYDFVDLDSNESFELFGKSLGGILHHKTLLFDNDLAKGELVKATPDGGLWIRKWKFTVFQKVALHKQPRSAGAEKKFILVHFLNPAIFYLNSKKKKIRFNGPRNNIFFTNDIAMDFSVVPKQPFYVLDVGFSASWLVEQFRDADPTFKGMLDEYIINNGETILIEPCSVEEYKTLHELEVSMGADNEDLLFIRSRVYNLVFNFFSKILNRDWTEVIQSSVDYERIMQVETMLMENLKELPKLESIAKTVNMSVSSLLRQFKLIYGKSIYEYYVEKKMEVAKKMILETTVTIKEMAEMLGYKQSSPFIESFTKHYGFSPGSLKIMSDQPFY